MIDADDAITLISEPARRRTVELLAERPRRTSDLAEALDMSVPAISRHLRVLRDADLVDRVDVDGDGRGREYRLRDGVLDAIGLWLERQRWTTELSTIADGPDEQEFLARLGGFLDGFAVSDATFFDRHLAADYVGVFPGSTQRWDRAATIDSVAGHPPYVQWDVGQLDITVLSPGITMVSTEVTVRTTATSAPSTVVQSMLFDDTSSPWTLRFLQQTPA